MVKDFIDVSPKELKKAQQVLQALNILGISQNDFLMLFKDIEQLKKDKIELESRLAEAEEYIRLQKIADTREIIQVSKDSKSIKKIGQDTQNYMTAREEFYPYGKPSNK